MKTGFYIFSSRDERCYISENIEVSHGFLFRRRRPFCL